MPCSPRPGSTTTPEVRIPFPCNYSPISTFYSGTMLRDIYVRPEICLQ